MRLRVGTVLVLLLVVLGTDPASALWTIPGAGSARATGSTLSPATAVTATWDPVVHVSWTASASTWASGYRPYRAVDPAGPYTQVADVAAPTTTVDDSPGAGTHYYAVRAYRGLWQSQLSNVVARAEATYALKGTTAFTDASCTAGGGLFDMQQGWSTSVGTQRRVRREDGAVVFCSDTFTTGQTLAAGTTTLTGHVSNTNGASCDIYASLSVNGTTVLGNATLRVGQSGHHVQSVSFETAGHLFASGDRLRLRLSWQPVNACGDTYFSWNSAGSPSRLTLTG